MRLSIIIPTLNEAENIGPLLDFFGKNLPPGALDDGRAAELIVADAESTDATAQIAREKGATVLLSKEKSRAAQMNLGARAASADLLYFVHADTRPPTAFFEKIEKAVATGAEMGCFRYDFDSPSLLLKVNAWFTRFPMGWCQGGDKTFFIKKAVFDALGGYCERHVVMEEYDFLRRAKKAGFKLEILPERGLVSARKYKRNSYLRVNLANFISFNLWQMGMEPGRLRRIYRRLLN